METYKKARGKQTQYRRVSSHKKKLEKLKKKAKAGKIDLYFQDESGFSLMPSVPYAWQYKGQSIKIPSTPSQRLNVVGFLQINQNWQSFVFKNNINSECLIAVIDQLFPSVQKETWIVMDNSPTHTSKQMMEKIKEWARKKIHVLFLPTYSPKLNLIELVWKFIKYYWLPFSAYEDLKKFTDALNNILANIGKKYLITFA
jgi:transposase